MGGAPSQVHCPNGWDEEGNLLREVDGRPRCIYCESLAKAQNSRCACDNCTNLRINALPDMVDDHVSCEFLHGVSKKIAGRVFNQHAWDACKNESGFVRKSHLIDPRALEKAVVLGEILRFGASELGECDIELRGDQDFMERCIDIDQGSLAYASPDLLYANTAFVRVAVKKNGEVLKDVSCDLRDDRVTVLMAIEQNGHALQFASESLRNDRSLVMTAVRRCGPALKYAADRLRDDKEVVLLAVNDDREVVKFASERLRNDPDIVGAATVQHGFAISDVSEERKADKACVIAAVRRNGDALKYTTMELRDDEEVVLVAVQQCGAALRFASKRLQSDPVIVAAAKAQAPWSVVYAAKSFRGEVFTPKVQM